MSDVSKFDDVARDLFNDPDRDVTVDGFSLLVHGQKFAYLENGSLVVRLPIERASDLAARGVAELGPVDPNKIDHWVRVTASEDWSELAAEAHSLAHGPLPGGES